MRSGSEPPMPERTLLLISLEPVVFVRLLPLLGDISFEVSTPSDPRLAIRAIAETRFHLIITAFPLSGVAFPRFLDELRGFGRPCRQSGLIAVATPQHMAEAATYVGLGLNRVVSTDDPDDVVREAVSTLLSVPPRVEVQAMVSLNPETASRGQAIVTQTANLSTNGMLVRHQGNLEVGRLVSFKLTLPGAGHEVLGIGEVVRATAPRRESIRGAGIRFVRLDDEGAARLRAFIDSRITAG